MDAGCLRGGYMSLILDALRRRRAKKCTTAPAPPQPPPPAAPQQPQAIQPRATAQNGSSWYGSLFSAAGWGLAVTLGVVVIILSMTGNGDEAQEQEKTTPAAAPAVEMTVVAPRPPASTGIPGVNAPGTATLVLRAGEPQTIRVPPSHRWKLLDPPLQGWTTDGGRRDEYGYRVQVFEVVAPVTEIAITNTITRCATPQECAW